MLCPHRGVMPWYPWALRWSWGAVGGPRPVRGLHAQSSAGAVGTLCMWHGGGCIGLPLTP